VFVSPMGTKIRASSEPCIGKFDNIW
jgi:hypothetical protein